MTYVPVSTVQCICSVFVLYVLIVTVLQVSDQIWVCDKKAVTPWKGDIRDYKKLLAKNMGL